MNSLTIAASIAAIIAQAPRINTAFRATGEEPEELIKFRSITKEIEAVVKLLDGEGETLWNVAVEHEHAEGLASTLSDIHDLFAEMNKILSRFYASENKIIRKIKWSALQKEKARAILHVLETHMQILSMQCNAILLAFV